MNVLRTTLLTGLIFAMAGAHAGVIVGGTRLLYDGAKKESSLSVNNPDKTPYLIQSWVDTLDGGSAKGAFIITPPLFRLDGEQQNVLRVVRAGGGMPEDKESMYWLNVKSIPSGKKQENTLQIAVRSRIKLIYRPTSLKGTTPEQVTDKLTWSHNGNQLQVKNPTSYYMNFNEITVGGHKLDNVTYVAPGSTASFPLPSGSTGQVNWKIINDYGAIGPAHHASL